MLHDDKIEWTERPLGLFDAPQLIQCRVCKRILTARANIFRPIRKTDRLRTTCRKCEQQTAYSRSVTGRLTAIRNTPALPPAVKTALIEAVPGEVKADKEKRRKVAMDERFYRDWTAVRRVIARRRFLLMQRLDASKHSGTGIWKLMEEHEPIRRYVRHLLNLYSVVTQRMRGRRELKEWFKIVGGHYPPAHWRFAMADPTLDNVMEVSMHEFTTKDERDTLKNILPDESQDPVTERAWSSYLDGGARTIKYHVYPHMMAGENEGRALGAMTPDWLRPFNGFVAPPPPPKVVDPDAPPPGKRGPKPKIKDSDVQFYDPAPVEHDEAEWERRYPTRGEKE